MAKPDPVEKYAAELGVNFQEFCESYLVSSWYDELVAVHNGVSITGVIPQGVAGRLHECGALNTKHKSKSRVNIGLVEALNSAWWLPDHKPGPYIPEVPDSEINVYESKKPGAVNSKVKSLGDKLLVEEEEEDYDPDPSYDPDSAMDLDYWVSDEEALDWLPRKDEPPKKQYRV